MKMILQNMKNVDGKMEVEKKEYQIPFVPAGAFLEYLEIEEDIENLDLLKPSEMKQLVTLIVKTFHSQFTEEEFFNGVPGYLLMRTFNEFIGALNTDPYANRKQKPVEGDAGNSEKKAD